MTTAQARTRADRENATRQAIAAAGLAGCEITPFGKTILSKLDAGEMTHQEAVDAIIARHRGKGWDTEAD